MASSQPDLCALECEFSDNEDIESQIPLPVAKQRQPRRKIVWKRVSEVETEGEARAYFVENWSHLRTQTTKIEQKTSNTYYCRWHGRPCPSQVKYEFVPGGKFVLYESQDEHNERGHHQLAVVYFT